MFKDERALQEFMKYAPAAIRRLKAKAEIEEWDTRPAYLKGDKEGGKRWNEIQEERIALEFVIEILNEISTITELKGTPRTIRIIRKGAPKWNKNRPEVEQKAPRSEGGQG